MPFILETKSTNINYQNCFHANVTESFGLRVENSLARYSQTFKTLFPEMSVPFVFSSRNFWAFRSNGLHHSIGTVFDISESFCWKIAVPFDSATRIFRTVVECLDHCYHCTASGNQNWNWIQGCFKD